MSKETRYIATENGINTIKSGHEDFPIGVWGSAELSYENVAEMLNYAYQLGRKEQREDIRKALGV
jgi:hypothetical protein